MSNGVSSDDSSAIAASATWTGRGSQIATSSSSAPAATRSAARREPVAPDGGLEQDGGGDALDDAAR